MHPTVSQYAGALRELTEDASPEAIAELTRNFVAWLRRRGELRKAEAVVRRLAALEAEAGGRLAVTAITARTPEPKTQKDILHLAERLFPDREIALISAVDPTVLGGVRLQTEESLYDATLAHKLQAFKRFLLKA